MKIKGRTITNSLESNAKIKLNIEVKYKSALLIPLYSGYLINNMREENKNTPINGSAKPEM